MARPNFGQLQYQGVGGLNPGRSVLDLSHAYSADMNFGILYPIVAEECVPGDVIKYGVDIVARMNPSIVPFMHEVNISWQCFFVPYRLTWPKVDESGEDWESYILGETWDSETSQFVPVSAELPLWDYSVAAHYQKGSLYDYFGFQPGVIPATGAKPHDLWRRAYNLIYNEWYRDEDLTPLVPISSFPNNTGLLTSCFEKDYFTSARPFQQKGIAPALPIYGSAEFDADLNVVTPSLDADMTVDSSGVASPFEVGFDSGTRFIVPKTGNAYHAGLDDNTVSGFSINMADLRLNMQIQKSLERNARAGNRYTEWLRAHYGISPSDDTLQRPHFIGGGKTPVVVSEVLQTSQTSTTPQGYMAGHGIAVDRDKPVPAYRVKEFGVFMVIARIMPRTMYTQGVHRRALRNSPYDFYRPEFAHLAEQAVTKGELFVNGATDADIFGYQARYQEYRSRNSIAVGEMRDTLKYWNLSRTFSGVPSLSDDFVSIKGAQRSSWMSRCFAVTSQAPFVVTFGNRIIASRPMPGLPEPGLMDHF